MALTRSHRKPNIGFKSKRFECVASRGVREKRGASVAAVIVCDRRLKTAQIVWRTARREHACNRGVRPIGMFMATNQFAVDQGCEKTFEVIWRLTHEHLKKAPGFVNFRFERGPLKGGRALYFVITVWERESDFLSWRCVELYGEGLRSISGATDCRSADLSSDDLDAAVSRDNPQ